MGRYLMLLLVWILIVSVDQLAQNLHKKYLQLGLLSLSKHKAWAHQRHSLSIPLLHCALCSWVSL